MSQGPFKAIVVANDDPEKACRIKVACPDLFWDPYENQCLDSGWCEASLSAGGGQGSVSIPPIGSSVYVYVEDSSEEGQLWQLMYTGGPVERVSNDDSRLASGIPDVAQGVDDESAAAFKGGERNPATGENLPRYQLPHVGMRMTASQDNDGVFDQIEEPSEDLDGTTPKPSEIPGLPNSPNEGEYPHNRVFKSPGGIVTEIDDTPGSERLHIWHPSGSYYEINKLGTAVERSANKFTETASRSEIVKGSRKQYIGDNHLVTVNGNELKKVKGRVITVASQIGLQTRSRMLLNSEGDLTIRCQGTTLQEHVAGRKLEVCGKDVISRFEKDETVLRKSQTTYGSDNVISFFGINAFPLIDPINAFPSRLARAQIPAATSVPLPGFGTGMCSTINIGPAYSTVLGPTMSHFEINNPPNLAALTATQAAGAPNIAEGASIRAPSISFKTQVPVVGQIPASPLVKWNLGNVPATGMELVLTSLASLVVAQELRLNALLASVLANSSGITALATLPVVAAEIAAATAAGNAVPAGAMTAVGTTSAAHAAAPLAAATATTAASSTALAGAVAIMANPATPGYTVAVRSQ